MQALPTPPLSATHPHQAQTQTQTQTHGQARADQPPLTYQPLRPQLPGPNQAFQFPPGMHPQQQQQQAGYGQQPIQLTPAHAMYQQQQQQAQSRPASSHSSHGHPQSHAQGSRGHGHHHHHAPQGHIQHASHSAPPQQHAPQQQQPAHPPQPQLQPQQPQHQTQPAPPPFPDAMRQAFADANALLLHTRTGLIGVFDGLLTNVAGELQARQEELDGTRAELEGAKNMNARIERDYRDLYRLAISLQRKLDQLTGEVEVLRSRKGADVVASLDKVKQKENRLWTAVDACIQACKCGAARQALSGIVLLPRVTTASAEQRPPAAPQPAPAPGHNQHRRDTSAQSHASTHSHASDRRPSTQERRPSTQTQIQAQVQSPLTAAHRRFSTGSTTLGSPSVPTGPSSFGSPTTIVGPHSAFQSPVVPAGAAAFPPQNAVNAGAFQIPVKPATPIVVAQPPVVPSQFGAQSTVPQPPPPVVPSQLPPAPHPSQQSAPRISAAQLLKLAEHPSQAQNKHALLQQALQQAQWEQWEQWEQRQEQAGVGRTGAGAGTGMGMATAGRFVDAANEQARQGLVQIPTYPEQHRSQLQPQPQASTSKALLEPMPPPQQGQQQGQGQWLALPKAAQMALHGLSDPQSPLRVVLRARAGLPTASAPPPISSSSTDTKPDIRTKLLAELTTRLQHFPPLDACVLLNLSEEQRDALKALSCAGKEGGIGEGHARVLEGLSEMERDAVTRLVNAVLADAPETGSEVKKEEVIDLTADSPAAMVGDGEAFTEEPQEMNVDIKPIASTSQQPEAQPPITATDDSPSRRRARSDSGVGTDISDASTSGEGGRAPKRARMSMEEQGEEGEITSPHLDAEREREIQQTLTPDATPRLRAATVSVDRMVEREAAPEDQGSIDPRALSNPGPSSRSATVPTLSSSAQTAFVNNFVQSLGGAGTAQAGKKSEMEQILGALAKAQSASGVVEGIVEAAYASSSQPPPTTPTPAPPPPAPVASAPPMERTRSVPIEPTVVVPATAPTTPTRSREFEPSSFVQSGTFVQAQVQGQPAKEGPPDHSPVLQSEQLLQMRTQAGYNGPYTGPPPHPYETQMLPMQGLPDAQQDMDMLPHVTPDLEVGVSGALPRLPDEATEERVLGPDHLALLFVLDPAMGGWACQLCLQRKEIDETFPVPVYPTGDGSIPNETMAIMSSHCAATHAEAVSYISKLTDEEARQELKEMMAEE